MPAGSLLALLDDITSVLDDVATLSKIAAKKTAGVLGDDLAVNAQQVAGVEADRELPIVWAVAKGSLVNKAILVPAALAISAVAGWAVSLLLMVGGAYLCFEGFEKLAHRWLPHDDARRMAGIAAARAVTEAERQGLERTQIRGAVRTDFVLSAEIIALTLGTVADADWTTRILVLVGVGLLITAGVYGLVAAIVKLDDLGLALTRRTAAPARALGRVLLATAPRLMRALSVVGTAAMFLVGGGILVHGWPALQHAIEGLVGDVPIAWLLHALAGVAAGAIVLGVVLAARAIAEQRSARA